MKTHPRHPKITEHTPPLPPHNTPIPDLRRAGIRMHLGELELGLGARALGERGVADGVAEGLSRHPRASVIRRAYQRAAAFPCSVPMPSSSGG